MHFPSETVRATNPASSKACSECFLTLCLQYTDDSEIPPVFSCSTEPLIEHLFALLSAPRGQRSGAARGQPPWSCDIFWILFKGTLVCQTPIDTTLWTRLSNRFRFRKPLQWKTMCSVWVSWGLITLSENREFIICMQTVSKPLIKLPRNYFPLGTFSLPCIWSLSFTPMLIVNSLELHKRFVQILLCRIN